MICHISDTTGPAYIDGCAVKVSPWKLPCSHIGYMKPILHGVHLIYGNSVLSYCYNEQHNHENDKAYYEDELLSSDGKVPCLKEDPVCKQDTRMGCFFQYLQSVDEPALLQQTAPQGQYQTCWSQVAGGILGSEKGGILAKLLVGVGVTCQKEAQVLLLPGVTNHPLAPPHIELFDQNWSKAMRDRHD